MKHRNLFLIISLGVTAMAAQIVLVREFLIVFSGDELSIGIVLAGWLISTAVGSLIPGRFSDRIKIKDFILWSCQIFLSVLLPLEIFAIRSIRPFLNISAGEIMPFHVLSVSSFAALLPLCAVMGFMFSLICSFRGKDNAPAAAGIGRIYAMECFGSMIGGTVVSLVLIGMMNSFEILSILSFVNALSALLFAVTLREKKKPVAITVTLLIIIFLILSWQAGIWRKYDISTLKKQWRPYDILSARNSIYGNITALKRGEQFSIFNNGARLYTVPDKISSEESAHFCLLEHAGPENILLIGGGIGGLLDESLKHNVKNIDYLELDPAIIKTVRNVFPKEYTGSLNDSRVRVRNTDGRYFIKTAREKYDCIIINLGDPYTAQINRFYTREFFRASRGILKEGGVLSFYLTASESYLSEDSSNFLRCVYMALKDSFSEVIVIPGETAYFLASNTKGALTYDYGLLMLRARQRRLDLKYVREYYLFSRMSAEKVSYFENILKNNAGISANSDFRPSAYYYGIISWSSRFRDSAFTKILKFAGVKKIWAGPCLFLLLTILFLTVKAGKALNLKAMSLLSIACAGFSQMAFQIILLFGFQVVYGYLFYKLGMLFTSFMLGLALSAYWISAKMRRIEKAPLLLALTQAGICVFALILPLSLGWLSVTKNHSLFLFGKILYFPLISFLSGFFGGLIFPLANEIYIAGKKEGFGKTAGLTYGLDVLGACFGSVLTAVFLIPIFGIFETCVFIALLNLACLWGIMRNR